MHLPAWINPHQSPQRSSLLLIHGFALSFAWSFATVLTYWTCLRAHDSPGSFAQNLSVGAGLLVAVWVLSRVAMLIASFFKSRSAPGDQEAVRKSFREACSNGVTLAMAYAVWPYWSQGTAIFNWAGAAKAASVALVAGIITATILRRRLDRPIESPAASA